MDNNVGVNPTRIITLMYSNIIVYLIEKENLFVIRFLHKSMNYTNHLS